MRPLVWQGFGSCLLQMLGEKSVKWDYSGRRILVTGASRGIGREIATAVALCGGDLICVARGGEGLEALTADLAQHDVRLQLIRADLSVLEDCLGVVEQVLAGGSTLDVIIHNAGGAVERGAFAALDDEAWIRTFELNVLSTVRLVRGLTESLSNSSEPRVLLMSSATAEQPGSLDPHYSACKAALSNLGKHLSNLLAPRGILVNTLAPGPIRTDGMVDFWTELASQSEAPHETMKDLEESLASRVPLHQVGDTATVAAAALFLCSKENQFITGANLRIDGGRNQCM